MNLLYYCDEYPPVRNGGIGTVVKLVAEAMAKRGHRVIVAGKYWEGQSRQTIEEINGVTVIRWHKGSYRTLGIRACDFIRDEKRLRTLKAQRILDRTRLLLERVVKEHQVDLLEMPDYVDSFIYNDGIVFPRKHFSIPLLLRVHGSVSFLYHHLQYVENEERTKQDKRLFDSADAVSAVSAFSKRYVEEGLCFDKPIEVIYNPIEDKLFANASESLPVGQTILFFGKIAAMKGVYSLIKAFNIVAEKNPQARLRLVGSGDINQAKQLVDSRFADRIEWTGFVPHEEIGNEIDKAAFCVLPSYFENFSMAALEVLARKRALIYTNRASGSELIEDGENGLLVNPDDVVQIADKMELLLSDTTLRDCLAEKGYEMCRRRFSTDVIIPQMESYYEEIIARCRK